MATNVTPNSTNIHTAPSPHRKFSFPPKQTTWWRERGAGIAKDTAYGVTSQCFKWSYLTSPKFMSTGNRANRRSKDSSHSKHGDTIGYMFMSTKRTPWAPRSYEDSLLQVDSTGHTHTHTHTVVLINNIAYNNYIPWLIRIGQKAH